MKRLSLLFCVILCCLTFQIKAQHSKIISGKVLDAQNGKPLYFASISLLGEAYGTTTDESGFFRLKVSENQLKDTLILSFIGYNYLKRPISQLDTFGIYKLQANAVNLEEVLVLPLKPEEYIKRAVSKIKENYVKGSFQSLAYYKEKLTENGHFIKQEEAIFKSFHFTRNDSSKTQHQIVNHRKVKNVQELQFMRDKVEKEYRKEVKKAKKKGDTTEVEPPDFSMEKIFGGPNMILALNVKNGLPDYIDTNYLDQFKYSFAPSTSEFNRDIIVINYKSKGKFEHMRSEGQIFLDANTYAFLRLTYSGEFVVPILIKPILFALGLRIIDPLVSYQTDYQNFNQTWYPKNFWWSIDAKLVKKHWFSANERSTFHIGQVYVVNEIKSEGLTPIPKEKRYRLNKKMEEQVFPERGIDWFGN